MACDRNSECALSARLGCTRGRGPDPAFARGAHHSGLSSRTLTATAADDTRDDNRSRRSTSSASTRSARCRWTRSRRPTPGTRARRWRWRPWPTRCGSDFLRFDPERSDLAEPRPLRALGRPRVDAALLAAAPDRREGGRPRLRDARRARGDARRHQAASASSTAVPGPPRVPLDHGRRDHDRPARPGRRRTASAWRSPAAGSARHFNRPGFELFDYNVYALCGDGDMMEGVSQRGRVARRALQALEPLLDLRQQPHHHRGQDRRSPSAKTSATRFLGYGWNVMRVGDANDLDAARRARSRPFKARRDRPTLIIVDSHIGYGAPDKQDTARRPRRAARRGRDAGWRSAATAGRRTRKFLVPDGVRRALRGRRRRARRGSCATAWDATVRARTGRSTPSSPTSSNGCSAASCPTAGTRTCPTFPADAKGVADARGLRQGAERDRRATCPG